VIEPICPSDQFVNADNKCVPKSDCSSTDYCNGEGGEYNSDLDDCFCANVDSNPDSYCDADCQFEALKVFFTKDGYIEMEAAGRSRVFETSDFGQSVFLRGLECPIRRC